MIVRFGCGRHVVVWATALGEPIATIVSTPSLERLESWCDVKRETISELIDQLSELLSECEKGDKIEKKKKGKL